MAIANLSQEQFIEILSGHFTPSDYITTPERLFGRQSALTQIERAMYSSGRQIIIHGDRGVGKSSVALTAAYLRNFSAHAPIYVVCGSTDTFGSIIQTVGVRAGDINGHFTTPPEPASFAVGAFTLNASYRGERDGQVNIPAPATINEALSIIQYVLSARSGNVVVVIDELERMQSETERKKFAEFIKNIPTVSDNRVTFIFCGIGSTVDELIGAHPSAGRILETVELDKINPRALWDIIHVVAEKTNITIDSELLLRIGQLSDGFPHYVHLIGECIFWSIFDDKDVIHLVSRERFNQAINTALNRVESSIKTQYDKATMKSRNTIDYIEALWALADSSSDKRQLLDIYTSSYLSIMKKRRGRKALDQKTFNQRLLTLRQDSHGNVVRGYGAGWFGFRENILRGYVRLVAEREGIALGAHDGSFRPRDR